MSPLLCLKMLPILAFENWGRWVSSPLLSKLPDVVLIGCVQFTDLNPELTPFQRRYVAFIKRCDEIERKIRYVNGEVVKLGVPVQSAGSVEHFVDNQLSKSDSVSASSLLEGLESKLDQYEQQLIDLNKYNNKLTEEYNGKVELHHVLLKARTAFMSEVNTLGDNDSQDRYERSALAMVEAVSRPPSSCLLLICFSSR
jgi:vacuolar-type H+-ATPase subunit I/STV1